MKKISIYLLQLYHKEIQQKIVKNVQLGINVRIWHFVNIYGCSIGDESMIGTFVEIQSGVSIGARCKISSHSFICEGVTIEDDVFIGHGVMFINDNHPQSTKSDGTLEKKGDWEDRFVSTCVKKGARIGSNCTILGGITIGEGALIGAGSVVTKDVPAGVTVAGNPARVLEK